MFQKMKKNFIRNKNIKRKFQEANNKIMDSATYKPTNIQFKNVIVELQADEN